MKTFTVGKSFDLRTEDSRELDLGFSAWEFLIGLGALPGSTFVVHTKRPSRSVKFAKIERLSRPRAERDPYWTYWAVHAPATRVTLDTTRRILLCREEVRKLFGSARRLYVEVK